MQRRKLEILTSFLGSYQKSGKEYLFACPKCNHHKNKLSINIEKDVYKCWVCDLKGSKIRRLIRRFGPFGKRAEWDALSPVELPADIKEYFEDFFNKEVVRPIVQLPDEFESLSSSSRSRDHREARQYLYSRGLTDWDILYWKIGVCPRGPYGGRVIIPSFDNNGNVNYFIGRAYKDFVNKYKQPKVNKIDIIFNELMVDWDEDLILVEGIFDAIKSGNAIPILGSTLRVNHKIFQEIVRHDTPVYLALDKDAVKKAFDIIEKLLQYEIEIYHIDTNSLKTDIGDIDKEKFLELKNKAVPMTPTSLLREKMRNII